ncbi:peptidyl-prolyl cis-trans isomerase FKBP8 [Thalassophryne amazonica]|uniref:peptidyl-prolyl cis-trans isomerase FKBP8 n=1 Tax=Thalassophryne amazonica TaxID=390379 RepID=UPI001471A459|nr:peptidyl-prolyl cis-trans isomerase FKBP8 [Thalassophryne amazonica]
MVSIALCSEMETQTCCEDSAVGPGEVQCDISELVDEERSTQHLRGTAEEDEEQHGKEQGEPKSYGEVKNTEVMRESRETQGKFQRTLKKTNSWKMVRFQDPSSTADAVLRRDSSVESLFPEYYQEEWASSRFQDLFNADDWENLTEDKLLRKKVLEPGASDVLCPTWGQEVTVKMQCVMEDRTVVEKDCKLVFVIGEGDVNQALEECVIFMQKGEITLLLADSQYAYGRLGREPDIPAWAPLLYQLQLLDIREKPDPLTLSVADRIRLGNQKRERGNFHFQREDYSMASRAYCMALDVLTTCCRDGSDSGVEAEEVQEDRIKCLNNLAATQFKLGHDDEALHTSRDVLTLEPNNVKALFRTGKLLSDKGEYKEAMEVLKKALKLEPATKAIHVELSKLVRRQSGGAASQEWKAKPAHILGENITPFLIPSKKKPSISWKFILGALVVALGSLVMSLVLTARN